MINYKKIMSIKVINKTITFLLIISKISKSINNGINIIQDKMIDINIINIVQDKMIDIIVQDREIDNNIL